MNRITQKKVLLLGGAYFQVPSIKYAKESGYYVITCDYLPKNPGHRYSDEYHNIDTTNRKEILELAKKLNIDGIVIYGSEAAVPTAAYVAKKLNLPGNPYKAVTTLIQKDIFREFLKNNNFNTPKAKSYTDLKIAIDEIEKFNFPIMVKPVDSSASRGVQKINNINDLKKAFEFALEFSKNKRVIIEEYIKNKGPQMHGDAFVENGKIVFCYLGDHHNNIGKNSFIPYATTIPSIHTDKILNEVEMEVQRLISLLNFRQGAINIEARINEEGKVYLIEVGPRNGGHLVPQFEKYASGFDMIKHTVDITLGYQVTLNEVEKKGFYALYTLHSEKGGKLKEIKISKSLIPFIIEKHLIKEIGDNIDAFTGIHTMIGVFIFKFPTANKMHEMIGNMRAYIKLKVN